METVNICSIPGCDRKTRTRGWCNRHYQLWLANGNPLIMKRAPAGSGWIDGYGYRKFQKDGIDYREHRYIMEKHLGRPLNPNEVVHHIDGNRLNNSIENLMIFVNQGEHLRIYRHNCVVPDCNKLARSKNLCVKHYLHQYHLLNKSKYHTKTI